MEVLFKDPKNWLQIEHSDDSPADGSQIQDQELLRAFRDGNKEAFAVLYRRHSTAVFRFAFYVAGNADTADELTQEVFVWLIQHPDAFDPDRGSLPNFLGGVTRKLLRRHQRRQRRWASLEDALEFLHRVGSSSQYPSAAESTLNAAQVRKAIALLPMRYREVIVLCDLQENDYAETARVVGCSVGTVRSRLHRGRNLLAKKLNPTKRQGDPHAL